MPAAPTPPARHARLFELIRQDNAIACAAARRRTAPPAETDLEALARRAARSLLSP